MLFSPPDMNRAWAGLLGSPNCKDNQYYIIKFISNRGNYTIPHSDKKCTWTGVSGSPKLQQTTNNMSFKCISSIPSRIFTFTKPMSGCTTDITMHTPMPELQKAKSQCTSMKNGWSSTDLQFTMYNLQFTYNMQYLLSSYSIQVTHWRVYTVDYGGMTYREGNPKYNCYETLHQKQPA